jgi:hypothetical protein
MIQRVPFLLMALVQVFFAVRCLHNPRAAKEVNIRMGTIWAKLPLSFYRGVGVACAAAALLFFYLSLYPPSQ